MDFRKTPRSLVTIHIVLELYQAM